MGRRFAAIATLLALLVILLYPRTESLDGSVVYAAEQGVETTQAATDTEAMNAAEDAQEATNLPNAAEAVQADAGANDDWAANLPTAAPTAQPTLAATDAPTPSPSPLPSPTPRVYNALYSGISDSETMHDVKMLQNRLADLGYLRASAIDGTFGAQTLRALTTFQWANGMEETGIADNTLLTFLYSDAAQPIPATTTRPPVSLGDGGEVVTDIQNKLVQFGFLSGRVDGDYGNSTMAAVRRMENYLRARQVAEWAVNPTAVPAPAPTPMPVVVQPTAMPDADGATAVPQPTIRIAPSATAKWEATGEVNDRLYTLLMSGDFPVYTQTIQSGDSTDEVLRIQRRLFKLGYLARIDGDFGETTELALKFFQYQAGLTESGIADEETQTALFSMGAPTSQYKINHYYIKVSIDKQRVYIYQWDGREYNPKPVQTFVCSTGLNDSTPRGTYSESTGPYEEWHYFTDFKCWAKYAWFIENDIMFHSVIYASNSESSIKKSTISKLGDPASHGCVRLATDDAQWLYEHCTRGTCVEIY